MPVISQSASGKAILLGEHAVVYGQPAIAIPISSRRVSVRIEPDLREPSGKLHVIAPIFDLDQDFLALAESHPIYQAISLTLKELEIEQIPACTLTISANLTISSGLGFSAALAVALIKALAEFLGHPLDLETVNRLAFICETFVHGHPSGIDNTTVTYEKPILFQKGFEPTILKPNKALHFVLADSGIRKSTYDTVAQLRKDLALNPDYVQSRIEEIGNLVKKACPNLTDVNRALQAELINRNQEILRELNLSCPGLDRLIDIALANGALAAKLTGGGKGGHMLALVEESQIEKVFSALNHASGGKAFQTSLLPEEN